MDIQVATGAATNCFAALLQPDRRAIINASRNFQRNFLFAALCTLTFTDRTNHFRNLACTAASLAGDRLLNLAKNSIHNPGLLTGAFTGRAGFHTVTRFDSRAFTVATFIVHIKTDVLLDAKNSLLKGERDTGFNVAATFRSTLLLTCTAAKELTENITQATVTKIKINILTIKAAEALERIAAAIAAATATTDTSVTELVIALAFLLVLQDFVGFVDFLKLGLITTFFVRVMLYRSLAEGLYCIKLALDIQEC
jgi:hypothetical protein